MVREQSYIRFLPNTISTQNAKRHTVLPPRLPCREAGRGDGQSTCSTYRVSPTRFDATDETPSRAIRGARSSLTKNLVLLCECGDFLQELDLVLPVIAILLILKQEGDDAMELIDLLDGQVETLVAVRLAHAEIPSFRNTSEPISPSIGHCRRFLLLMNT